MTKKGEQTIEPEGEKSMLVSVRSLESRWHIRQNFAIYYINKIHHYIVIN